MLCIDKHVFLCAIIKIFGFLINASLYAYFYYNSQGYKIVLNRGGSIIYEASRKMNMAGRRFVQNAV